MLKKLAAVIGTRMPNTDVEQVDPDPSYVLTWDNLLKMLAVLMRLRLSVGPTYSVTTTIE